MIEKILTDYIIFIRSFEALLKDKYQQDINPCSFSNTFFERIGSIDGIEYHFHGAGCTAQRNGVIYTYDISIFEKDIIEFSQWEFTELIRTHPEYQKLNYSTEYIEYELYQLINKGILDWVTIEGIEGTPFGCVFKCYRVVQESFFVSKSF